MQHPSSVDYEISHVMVVQVGPVGMACLSCGDSPCSLRVLGHSRGTALLLQGSEAKGEHGFALAACLVQGNWAGA